MNMQARGQGFETVAHLNGERRLPDSAGSEHDSEYERVKEAFIKTFVDEGNEGLFTEFLFFTPRSNSDVSPIGGHAWDIVSTASDFDHAKGTEGLLNNSISAGLMDLLPPNIKLVENGPGTFEVWKKKTGPLLRELLGSPDHEVQSALFIDKSRRYAQEPAVAASTEFKIEETYGLKGDFVGGKDRIRVGQGTPLSVTWGGPFANAPSYDGGPTEIESLVESFHNMREQHGMGAHFLIEIDLPQDIKKLEQSYSVNPPDSQKRVAFRNFVLSGIFRAAHNGLIKNENYDVLAHWDANTEIEEVNHLVLDKNGKHIEAKAQKIRLSAVSKKAHVINYDGGRFNVANGYKPRTQILSHKFSQSIWEHAARQAGADGVRFFVEGDRALMYGRFSKRM